MSSQTLGIVIGGLIPAILFGVGNVAIKSATQTGLSTGWLMVGYAVGIALVTIMTFAVLDDGAFTKTGSLYALLFGLCMGLGTFLVSIAITKYMAPVSVVTPLYNMNTLVAVVLALWIFSEWKTVYVPQLLLGSLLIIVGGALVARA